MSSPRTAATVDNEVVSGHEARSVRAEKDDDAVIFARLGHAAEHRRGGVARHEVLGLAR